MNISNRTQLASLAQELVYLNRNFSFDRTSGYLALTVESIDRTKKAIVGVDLETNLLCTHLIWVVIKCASTKYEYKGTKSLIDILENSIR